MAKATDRMLGVLLGLAALLVLPGVALAPLFERIGAEWLALPGLLGAASFANYAFDKRRAVRRGERTPEAQLLMLDALGGWPGGLAAQHLLRHKNAKTSYQVVFWLIVAAHQGAAVWWLFG